MYAGRRETVVNMCADMLIKFQWRIAKHQFNTLDLGPGSLCHH